MSHREGLSSKEVNGIILKHYLTKSDKEISDILKKKGFVLSQQAVRKRRESRGLRKGAEWGRAYQRSQVYGDEISFQKEAERLRDAQEERALDKRYKQLLIEHQELKETLDANKKIGDVKARPIPKPKKGKGEVTMVALLSDWHIEEHVTYESTNGRNEYNLELSKKRGEYYFTTLLKLIEIEQQSIPVNRLVIALLGDFFTGNIHEEAVETNLLGTTPAVRRAEEYLLSGIQYILDNSDLELTIICHSGNHARITKKQRHGNEHAASLEYLMYHNMASYFRSEKRVEFIIPEAYHSYLTIYDTVLRFHHGHNIRYSGGIGGITTPVVKAINPWNTVRHADIDLFGHFHQAFDGGRFIANGSLIGFNGYAVAIKADYQPPCQVMFGIHSELKISRYMTRYISFPF